MMRGILNVFSPKIRQNLKSLSSVPILGSRQLNVLRPSFKNFYCFSSVINKMNILSFQPSNNSNNLYSGKKQALTDQCRTFTRFSLIDGKKITVEEVPQKFFRLRWGIWIRTIAGRHKKLWKKSHGQKNRLLQHVFCNSTQSKMLDKMVTDDWKKPKYYIEDPYEIYHSREGFCHTKRKPWRPDE